MRVAGLSPVQVPTIENVNVTELVPGHMAYRTAMPKLLREVGWEVESDEFTEIEDPDPENHEKRQRELISEIEEARKELEKKAAEKEKKGSKLSWWKRKKGDKKEWEVYDESSQKPVAIDREGDPAKIAEHNVMFDIDAIRREVAVLAAESKPYDADERDFEIKEIKSTLPPMKIELRPQTPPLTSPYGNLRGSKSYNDSLGGTAAESKADDPTKAEKKASHNGNGAHTSNAKKSFEEYDEGDAGEVEMTFDTSFREPTPIPFPSPSPSASKTTLPATDAPSRIASPWQSTTPTKQPHADAAPGWSDPPPPERPPLLTAKTAPHPAALNGGRQNPDPLHNAWADDLEDEFAGNGEGEVKMSFM
jgi:hypothetical protein